MFQLPRFDAVKNARHIDHRGRNQFSRDHARLIQMKSAWARENYGAVVLDAYGSVALLVEITERPAQARQNICHAFFMMRPLVDT